MVFSHTYTVFTDSPCIKVTIWFQIFRPCIQIVAGRFVLVTTFWTKPEILMVCGNFGHCFWKIGKFLSFCHGYEIIRSFFSHFYYIRNVIKHDLKSSSTLNNGLTSEDKTWVLNISWSATIWRLMCGGVQVHPTTSFYLLRCWSTDYHCCSSKDEIKYQQHIWKS